ncbi:MAG: family 20 glycosylhydrolase [Armatimonadota bacterium]
MPLLQSDPSAPFCGLLYELTRGNHQTLPALRRFIRVLAECDVRQLVLYMEDLWQYEKHPQLSNPRAYRLVDMEQLAEDGARHGVELIPSLTTLGHSHHILTKPDYRHLAFPGDRADFDVLNPAVFDLFNDLFDEVLPHFTSPYVFLNGDEVNYTALHDAAKAVAVREGVGALYGTGMGKLTRMILERGRRPIIWHDMLLYHPEAMAYLPKETIIAYWFYDSQPAFPAIEFFCNHGFDVLAAPGLVRYREIPDYARALPNIHGQVRAARACMEKPAEDAGRCLGALTTVWAESPWQGAVLAAYATGRWMADPELSEEKLLGEFARDLFGMDDPGFAPAWREATRAFGPLFTLKGIAAQPLAKQEKELVKAHTAQRQQQVMVQTDRMRQAAPARNRDIYRRIARLADNMAHYRPWKAAPPAAQTLYIPEALDADRQGCRLLKTRTRYHHDLLIVSNGSLAVAVLPEFGATMIEWVLFDQPTHSWVTSWYDRWAAAQPRVPGGPGLWSPWGNGGIGGWREMIFFNARHAGSTLWGRPFATEVLTRTDEEVALAFYGANEVTELRRVIRLRRGQPALEIEMTAINRYGDAVLAFQPNPVHLLPDTPTALLEVVEGDERTSEITRRSILDHDGTRLCTPRGTLVRIESPITGSFLEMRFRRDEVSQVLMDGWTDIFTLEPLGFQRASGKGEGIQLNLEYRVGGPVTGSEVSGQ